jgi:adenosine/AMP kinase
LIFFQEEQMEIKSVRIENPDSLNMILGQSHFIKTVEDVHEVLVETVPGIKFGLAFCESSGPRLVRAGGTDPALVELAQKNALLIGAGHCFILFLGNAYPVNVLRVLRTVSEIVTIFCASANPVEVIVAESEQGRGILGVIDGNSPLGVEGEDDVKARQSFLRKIGYKLG